MDVVEKLKIGGCDAIPSGQHAAALHGVFEFAYVAGPVISDESRCCVGRQTLSKSCRVQKMLGNRHYVGDARA